MKKIIAVISALAMSAALFACGDNSKKEESGNYIFGKISSIDGNDITLKLATYTEKSTDDDEDSSDESAEQDDGNGNGRPDMGNFTPPGDGEMPDMEGFTWPDGEMPDMEGFSRPDGEMPDMEGFTRPDGEMPDMEGFTRPDGEMPDMEGFSRPDGGDSGFGGFSDKGSKNSNYSLTGEESEIMIPAGATVTTLLGVESTFSALKEGDVIKCSVETDDDGTQVVTAVWIVE